MAEEEGKTPLRRRLLLKAITGSVATLALPPMQLPALGLSDEDVANALTFVYSQWGNAGHEVTPAEVKAVRAEPVKQP